MQKKKTATKAVANKPKTRKMDRRLISKQPWEILYVRLIFHKIEGDKIIHPLPETVKMLLKDNNNSRRGVYADLVAGGYTKTRLK